MIIFDYFITEYICLNGLFITFIIFNDSISKDIFFDAFPITAIVLNDSISKDVFLDGFLSLISYRMSMIISDRICTITSCYPRDQNKLNCK